MQHPFVLAVIVLGFAWMWGINRGTAVAADTYKRRQPSSPADVVPIQLTVITTNDMHSSVQCYLLIYPITFTPCAIPNTSADTDTARLSSTRIAMPSCSARRADGCCSADSTPSRKSGGYSRLTSTIGRIKADRADAATPSIVLTLDAGDWYSGTIFSALGTLLAAPLHARLPG